ncbi:hypothetical protein MESS2_p30006 [Mesorhizobium metallidurans STM 2683]|uniref:Uncharacterized protein n=1 Tax=Mesorhizobium metallidurans STM 2683 TaxID=1297569 RepID=M5FC62_9HYPH|nr:hypothetical protein MESS2_p30006 [Mesorhizobium metallidurans STM 2683]
MRFLRKGFYPRIASNIRNKRYIRAKGARGKQCRAKKQPVHDSLATLLLTNTPAPSDEYNTASS